MEEISYSLDALHGLGDFNKPGRTAQVAAKLITRLYIEKRFPSLDMSILIYKPSQEHFPLWLLNYLEQNRTGEAHRTYLLALLGRNILALEEGLGIISRKPPKGYASKYFQP